MNGNLYKKRLYLLMAVGFIIVGISGTLAHFIYDWSGQNKIVGLFTAVNESTWEHMKLLYFPMLLFTLITWIFFRKSVPSLAYALLISTIAGTMLIPVIFYTYTGVLGYMITWVNLAIYYISIFLSFITAGYIVIKYEDKEVSILLYVIITILICMFFIFTYEPPELGIFVDPTK